eukprot:m.4637 g.4637  ORF g.4637 m.4637 type:complete len:327 (+) comp2267_c0_seq1:114-1094(+)
MRPIALNGHTRALTSLKFNREGDLIFSTAKDSTPAVWYSDNGERLGTFEGHTGAVWCCDVDYLTKYFVSGSADNTLRLWDVQTGENIYTLPTETSTRACAFSLDGKKIAYCTDATRGLQSKIAVIDVEKMLNGEDDFELAVLHIKAKEKKATTLLWGVDRIISGHLNGDIVAWDIAGLRGEKKPLAISSGAHTGAIMDLQFSSDYLFFISASKDHTAQLFNSDTLVSLKKYESERPANTASLSPLRQHVIVGGGQEASMVTTQGKSGKFDARLYDKLTQEEFGLIKGHFGPINTVAFHPNGKGYASGGEDGYIRIHVFDKIYFEYQ